LGRACPICHKYHSREPREAWPLTDRERYGAGDKDEKSVNGTQISIGKFPLGKRDYLFRKSVYLGKFESSETNQKSCSIYIPTRISESFGKWKTSWET